jgi:uncharacterized membrane protein
MAKRSTAPDEFLHESEKTQIENAVSFAESTTSAEVKVVIVRHCWSDIRKKAASIFKKHQLDRTAQRNCVLILLVTTNREFLIYGDEGIHQKVGQDFWEDVRDEMIASFKRDRFGDGLAAAVRQVGEKLGDHFPRQRDDVNEVSDEVIHDE